MRIFQEEIFGPVVSVTRFADEDDALKIANDTLYGLGAGVWTRDGARAYRVGREIQAGRVWTNCYHAYPAHAAFGGYKQSGVGRETHKMMLDHYQQTKNLLVSYSPEGARLLLGPHHHSPGGLASCRKPGQSAVQTSAPGATCQAVSFRPWLLPVRPHRRPGHRPQARWLLRPRLLRRRPRTQGAEWLAHLLECGLLAGSLDEPQRKDGTGGAACHMRERIGEPGTREPLDARSVVGEQRPYRFKIDRML